MPYYKDAENKVHFLDDESFEVLLPAGFIKISDDAAHELENPIPSVDELKTSFLIRIQQHIDTVAQSRGYDSGVSLTTYATDTHPPFASEAAAFIPWRSTVWLYCYTEWAKFEAGLRTFTTPEAFVAELPAITWPT